MAYSKFQFIALETPTFDPVTPAQRSDKDTDYVAKWVEVDKSLKLSDDAKARLNWIRNAVEEAWASNHVKIDDTDTLKIFAAPEFFFRPEVFNNAAALNPSEEAIKAAKQEKKKLKIPDPERFYPLDEAESIVKLFGVLFSQETLKDWIIIPGTILGSFENNSPITKNQAYVIKGGEKDPKKAILTKHTKLNTPGGDGVPERSRFTIKPPKGDLTPQKEYEINWMAKVRTNIIDLGGFTLGIDLCMDHGARVLYRTCKRWAGKDDKALGVHLQLLVACGHLLKPESIATFKGGILLRVEGASTQTPYSQALKVTKTDWDDYALSDFERHDPDAPYLSPKEVPRRSQPTIKVKAQKAYNYTECLRVYTATVIPVKEAEKVQAP